MTNTRALSLAVMLFAAIGVFGVGVHYGTFAAADTDPYGYISEAELIARGALRVDQRFALTLPWREAELSFIPTGFKRGTTPGVIVPTYPAGLPLIMAAAMRVADDRDAVFYVVPILGAVMVCATAALGRRLWSDRVGAAAAVLLATSPSFVLQVTQPVSDVPAAAWWTLSVVLTLHTAP
jgi:asparagine N-glycosylation enzyme membrane subunit Stt3